MMSAQSESAPADWELLDDQLLNQCRVWDLRVRRYRHPRQGDNSKFYYLDSLDWVIIIARTLAGELILIRQFRCGSNALSWELPGGIVDKGEDPVAAGLRELREETGYRAGHFQTLGHCWPAPGLSNEIMAKKPVMLRRMGNTLAVVDPIRRF